MPLMRSLFLSLSRSHGLRQAATRFRPVRAVAYRFVAGETLD